MTRSRSRRLAFRLALLAGLASLFAAAFWLGERPVPRWQLPNVRVAFSPDGSVLELTDIDTPFDYLQVTRLVSLDTGEVRWFRSRPWNNLPWLTRWLNSDDDQFIGRTINEPNVFDVVTVSPTDLSEVERFHIDGRRFWGIGSMTPEGLLATADVDNQLLVWDFKSGRQVASPLPPLQQTSSHFWFVRWLPGRQRLLVSEKNYPRIGKPERALLFSWNNGQLESVGQWVGSWTRSPVFFGDDGRWVTVTPDGVLQVRDSTAGLVCQTIQLRELLNVTPPITAEPVAFVGDRLLLWLPGDEFVGIDLGTSRVVYRQTLLLRQNNILETRDWIIQITSQRAIAAYYLADGTSQRPAWQAQLPGDYAGLAVPKVGPPNRLLVYTANDAVSEFDLRTGKRVRVVELAEPVIPVLCLLLAGSAVWGLLWVRLSVRVGSSPIIDLAVLHGAVLTGLLFRVFLYGSRLSPYRPIYQVIEAQAVSWLTLAAFWFVFGRGRWSARMVVPLLTCAGVVSICLVSYHGPREAVLEVLLSGIGLSAALAAIFGVCRRWGWRLVPTESPPFPPFATAARRIPLRDFFAITFGIAAVLAAARYAKFGGAAPSALASSALLVASTCLATVVATWAAFSQRRWWLRISVLAVAVLGLGSLQAACFSFARNLEAWNWQVTFGGYVALFTFLSVLIIRTHGWRWSRS